MLTRYTRRSADERRIVIKTVDLPYRGFMVALIALLPALIATAIMFMALTVTGVMALVVLCAVAALAAGTPRPVVIGAVVVVTVVLVVVALIPAAAPIRGLFSSVRAGPPRLYLAVAAFVVVQVAALHLTHARASSGDRVWKAAVVRRRSRLNRWHMGLTPVPYAVTNTWTPMLVSAVDVDDRFNHVVEAYLN